jgi:hypothetical protein
MYVQVLLSAVNYFHPSVWCCWHSSALGFSVHGFLLITSALLPIMRRFRLAFTIPSYFTRNLNGKWMKGDKMRRHASFWVALSLKYSSWDSTEWNARFFGGRKEIHRNGIHKTGVPKATTARKWSVYKLDTYLSTSMNMWDFRYFGM